MAKVTYPDSLAAVAVVDDGPSYIRYMGSRESLIRTGRVRAGQFPGDPGMRKCKVRLVDGVPWMTSAPIPESRLLVVITPAPQGWFELLVYKRFDADCRRFAVQVHQDREARLGQFDPDGSLRASAAECTWEERWRVVQRVRDEHPDNCKTRGWLQTIAEMAEDADDADFKCHLKLQGPRALAEAQGLLARIAKG